MKKVLYGIFAITALAATSVSAAPVQVGEAAGSAATSVSAGRSFPTTACAGNSGGGGALGGNGGGDGVNNRHTP
ncbi:exopolysaccharide production protein YjbE, partial [Salmonella enterica]|uniref:exopolysaccharide production protein YjbE n=1 Tax=Salmonella enterica TaxID=28901 RepID=UPI000871F2A2